MLLVKTQTVQCPQSHRCLRRGTTCQGEKLFLRADGQSLWREMEAAFQAEKMAPVQGSAERGAHRGEATFPADRELASGGLSPG